MKIIVVSGGFDPIHSGHIEYLKCAKEPNHGVFTTYRQDAILPHRFEWYLRVTKKACLSFWHLRGMMLCNHPALIFSVIHKCEPGLDTSTVFERKCIDSRVNGSLNGDSVSGAQAVPLRD